MLDYSKRSRSGKFRLVTKFKKEKNNKNKETHSSMGLPGTKSAHSLCLFVTSVWSHHYLFSVCFLTHPLLLFHLHLPLLAGLVNLFHVANSLLLPSESWSPCTMPTFLSRNRKYPLKNSPLHCADFHGYFRGCLEKWIWGFWHFKYKNDCGAQVRVTPVFSLLVLCDTVNDIFLIDSPSGFNQVPCLIGWGSASSQVFPDL